MSPQGLSEDTDMVTAGYRTVRIGDEEIAAAVGLRWWTAANDNAYGDFKIGPLDRAHIALAMDRAAYKSIVLEGEVGMNSVQVVLMDDFGDPRAVLDCGEDCDFMQATEAESVRNCDEWLDLPVIAIPDDLPEGSLDLKSDVLPLEDVLWDGEDEVVFSAYQARQFLKARLAHGDDDD